MRVKGVIMLLALHYWMRDAHHCSGPPPRLRNDLYCVEWDVKLYYTIPHMITDRFTNFGMHEDLETPWPEIDSGSKKVIVNHFKIFVLYCHCASQHHWMVSSYACWCCKHCYATDLWLWTGQQSLTEYLVLFCFIDMLIPDVRVIILFNSKFSHFCHCVEWDVKLHYTILNFNC